MNLTRLSALGNSRPNLLEGQTSNGNGHSKTRISEIFGMNAFTLPVMKEFLSEGTYNAVVAAIRHNEKINHATAESVAKGLKKWATDNGATHYTHWFQPLTGATAEKHDAFYKPSLDINVQGMENLTAAELVQREPDASSFPHGGLRSTAAARGYTVWDPSSPAFILETKYGKTLYIPSIYISYTGEALDYKTPLLKSCELINQAATAVCRFFDPEVNNVIATLGWEQEYFVVDSNLYNARPDLMITGRTLFGGKPARNQQLEDHYFASIPERVQNYMQDFERECLKLGIPVLTRHNEVAPGQYECAPMFEELNMAVDHNLLLMIVMDKVARRHGLRVIFHEKPFAGVNGSGKHNNWSLATDKGKNLLSPGEKPGNNLYFLTFFINVVKALEENADLLRAGIASAANEHRLGANEAPPAIISVFTGSLIEDVLNRFKKEGLFSDGKNSADRIDLKIPKIPEALLDNTDRNRTSPFPFTGNKFEFRAVGASANCSSAMTMLNTIVAHQLFLFKEEVDGLVSGGATAQDAIISVLQRYAKESERIIFNGDGYSKEWEKEANKRGLSNTKSTPDALKALTTEKAKRIFTRYNLLNERELEARYNVLLEQYIKQMEIEMMVIEEMVHTHILPSTFQYIQTLSDAHSGFKEMGLTKAADKTREEVELVYNHFLELKESVSKMLSLKEKAFQKEDHDELAAMISLKIKPLFEVIRLHADQLEKLVDDTFWRLPKYRELLFVR